MLKIRSVFRRIPSVTYNRRRGEYRVHGSPAELLMMCTACAMALERRGVDTSEMRHALYGAAQKYIAGMAEGGEADEGRNHSA